MRPTDEWWRSRACAWFGLPDSEMTDRGVEIYKQSTAGRCAELSFQLNELMTAARPRWIPKRWWPWPKDVQP